MIQAHSPSKQNYVTVLAIYDDPVPRNARQTTYKNVDTSAKKLQIQGNKTAHETLQIQSGMEMELTKDNHCVEVKNFSQFPSSGLQVQIEQKSKQAQKSSTYNFDEIPPTVHFAPEQEKVKNNGCEQNWRQNNARKSRISDTFLDAKERIDNYEKNQWSKLFHPENYRFERIILSIETCDSPMGIEISAVPNPDRPSHLLAVEVRTIEQKGRIAQDGRLRVGDQIVDINGMPCEQLSFARARLHFRELQSFPEPSISFFRKLNQNKNAPTNLQQTEQLHVLQKGNTSKIGQCKEIKLIRGKDGFGFNYAGRMNAKKEHLYYVKGLRLEQGLAVGDRILRIDGIDLSSLGQADVTALFKSKQIGEAITLLISRTEEMDLLENGKTKQEGGSEGKENFQEKDELEKELAKKIFDDLELLRFEIPLNETPGAGLGISVKAQRKASIDMGLYIRSILHGSAAYRDGRLRINDRLVGVEAVNLLKYQSNGEALDTFMRTLTQLPHGKSTVRVYVARAKNPGELQRWGSDSELSQSEGFIRDSTARRSISEKRPLGLHNDPAHLKTYQRIVHQRQTSAPALSTVARARRSLHEPAKLNNENARANDGNEQRTAKNRPKSTFYTNEDVGYSNTLPSPKSHQIHDDGPPASGINSLQQIGASKSQPESLAFLTRSGTVPVQNGEDGAIRQSSKRRSSLGSGLLKLFGRSKEEPRQMHQHRPPPPPYHQHWPPHPQPPHHHFQQYYPQQPSSTSTNHLHHLHPSSSSPQSHSSSLYSPGPEFFRHPRPQFHGPGLAEVPHWPHGDEELSRRRRLNPHQQSAIFKQTITSHSMFGSRAGHPPSAFSPPVSDHFHWQQHSLLARPDNQNKIGKAQPSAVFYNDSGSHWVIRC